MVRLTGQSTPFRKDENFMSSHAVLPPSANSVVAGALASPGARRSKRSAPAPTPFRFPAFVSEGDIAQRQAELFYLQKQIQSQTPMVIVLEDGEQVEGHIE